jgi:diacylglycerol kinase (ATP)
MKIAIILNGISRKKKRFYRQILPSIQNKFSVEVFETLFSGHAIQLSGEAVIKGFDIILSAGGDGTLNQVVNGIVKAPESYKLPVLGIIPLGSGNDFAGMMGVSGDPLQLLKLLEQNNPKSVDVGKISCLTKQGDSVEKYFINVCSLGMGPATVHRLERLPRWMGTNFRYYASVLNTFFTHPTEKFEVSTPGWTWKGNARVVAIANGKSFGNKIYIAPDAQPDDGIFSTFIATDMPLLKFLFVLMTVKMKKIVRDHHVIYSIANELEITSPDSAWIEAEGELAGLLPARIELQKGRIQFLG